jgi:diaminopimelate decarboxylase
MNFADKILNKDWMIRRLRYSVNSLFSKLDQSFNQREMQKLSLLEDRFAPELWNISSGQNGHLIIQHCDFDSLAKQYGTPLFVVDKARLKKNYTDFYNSFHQRYPHVEVSYSYKTNPLPGVLKVLHEFGAGAEVVSPFELWLALRLNVPPSEIIYNGPAKTEESLKLAISNNIKLINLDGPSEIDAISRLVKKCGHKQNIGIRVITSIGWRTKFGFSIKTGAAFKAFKNLKEVQNIELCGLHVHLGTIEKIDVYLQAIGDVLDLSKRLQKELGISIKYFDFGGGFPVRTTRTYSKMDHQFFNKGLPARATKEPTSPSINDYSQAIIELFKNYFSSENDNMPTVILEPGRSITCTAQSLLLKVLEIKPLENGIITAILDGGKNVASPLRVEYHEIFHASKMNETMDSKYKLFGPTCNPADIVCPVKRLPALRRGDILAIMDAGAYWVGTQSNFCFPRAPAIMIENGHHELIRKSESFEHMVALDLM